MVLELLVVVPRSVKKQIPISFSPMQTERPIGEKTNPHRTNL
jgi:hypothetical protein